jgi:bacteriocin-like protein
LLPLLLGVDDPSPKMLRARPFWPGVKGVPMSDQKQEKELKDKELDKVSGGAHPEAMHEEAHMHNEGGHMHNEGGHMHNEGVREK